MKRTLFRCLFIFTCVPLFLSLIACERHMKDNTFGKENKGYYKEEDFQTLIVGKSTYQDMCEIVGPKPFFATSSYAAVCEYPMEDGGCIRVKFVLGDRSANDLSSNLIVAVVEADPIGSEFETNSSLS